MKFRDWATRVIFISLMFTALILALFAGKGTKLSNNPTNNTIISNPEIPVLSQYPQIDLQSKNQASKSPNLPESPVKKNKVYGRYKTTEAFAKYRPPYEIASVHPSNYGERYAQDVNGIPVKNQAIIVLHETGYSASSAINFFQSPHEENESIQASYHTLIKLDGTIVYLLSPEKRAFGAANSVFNGIDGPETVQTNPNLASSVNNFAYHVSLETPPDGRGDNIKFHSGYTQAQYNSLAWLIAQSQVPDDRITTHKEVDRSGQKIDPLSFDFDKFLNLLHTFRQISPVYRAAGG
ncbi:N-acetylmuramoyl-L-alanine amidase [Nostoc sp. NIES-4103]|nr:N-acetylmuramoyl-L-alanine amidase [Nostoc sp. NIES-4103]